MAIQVHIYNVYRYGSTYIDIYTIFISPKPYIGDYFKLRQIKVTTYEIKR